MSHLMIRWTGAWPGAVEASTATYSSFSALNSTSRQLPSVNSDSVDTKINNVFILKN